METGERFLDGFGENVISELRSIRIFGKRFIESEIATILVQGVASEHYILGRFPYVTTQRIHVLSKALRPRSLKLGP